MKELKDFENENYADTLLDEEKLSKLNNLEKVGTIYNCNGPYKFIEDWGEEDEEEDSWE